MRREEMGLPVVPVMNETEFDKLVDSGNLTVADIDIAINSRTTSPNMLIRGIYARETSTSGWNQLAQPYIVFDREDEAPAVSFSFGMSRAIVTLPPVPDYNPNGDETLRIRIPGSMLRSGVDTEVPDVSIRVLSDMADCQVGEWGPWSDCDEVCAEGTQTRQRQVLRAPRG